MKIVQLKAGKERPILQRHHWIYSGAVLSAPKLQEGDLVTISSHAGETLGLAIVRPGESILGHMIAFAEESLEEALRTRIQRAHQLRSRWVNSLQTNAYRLIHAEGDGLPGLIVDSYAGHLVMQISHPGMETLKPQILSLLQEEVQPKAIFEKSTSHLRKKGGLEEVRTHLFGTNTPRVDILENGLRFQVELLNGQKTGFFLDQREMRHLVQNMSRSKKVLNCFAYTGGFSVSAFAGGAASVDSVEISLASSLEIEKNLSLNGDFLARHRLFTEDVFSFLQREELLYDLIILDPPAFTKKPADLSAAFRAYKELNQMALSKMPSGSLLLTSSCSYHISEELFQNILFRAALAAQREVKILETHRMAADHPISLFHPESRYLKSFLLYVGTVNE